MVTTTGISTFDANQNAANAAAAAQDETATESVSSDYEDFLILMTTQMKNQDPLKPMDSTEFVSQLAQFSGVEQQVNMNTKLDSLLNSFNNGQFDEAALYLGKMVTAPSGNFVVADGASPEIEYTTPDNAVAAKMEIYDQFGAQVKSFDLNIASGTQTTSWNLLDEAGDIASDGTYRAEIVSYDGNGTPTRTNANTKNKVMEVIKTETGFNLKTETGDILDLNEVTSLAETSTIVQHIANPSLSQETSTITDDVGTLIDALLPET